MTTLRGYIDPRQVAVAPPARAPRPVPFEATVFGRRMVLILVDDVTGRSRYLRDYRATSEVVTDGTGTRVVHVAPERDWYAWNLASRDGDCPNSERWPAELVWAE